MSDEHVYYKLSRGKIVRISRDNWYEWITHQRFPKGERFVARTHLVELALVVSTIFFGIPTGYDDSGNPYVFETSVFGDDSMTDIDTLSRRYTNLASAKEGHEKVVALLMEAKKDEQRVQAETE